MSDSNWWAERTAPPVPSSEEQLAWLRTQDAYNTAQAQTSSSLVYTGQWQRQQATRPKIYENVAPRTLEDYASSAKASKHARKQGEPAESYLRRLDAHGVTRNIESLAPAEREQVEADIAAARAELEQADSHEALRGRLDAAEATAGLFGSQTAAAKIRTELDQGTAAATSALRTGVAYEPTSPGVPRVDIAGVLRAEEQARGAAVAARYAHGNLRPSDGLHVTTS